MWQGLNATRDYNVKLGSSLETTYDELILSDELNAFYAHFEQNGSAMTSSALTASGAPAFMFTVTDVSPAFLGMKLLA